MSYLIDSDWVAAYLKGRPDALHLLRTLASAGLAISLITHGEISEGIYFGRDPRTAAIGYRKFLRDVDVLPLNRRIMERFARIRGELRRQGLIIADMDMLIAGTALHHHRILITGNVRHFQRIPDLALYQQPSKT
jgi:tRNA(fMet)-specific endonuclease VapC